MRMSQVRTLSCQRENMLHDQKVVDRFNKYVVRGAPDECWTWVGAGSGRGNGYGKFRTSNPRKSKPAHIFAWEVHNGRRPAAGLFICHSCDNPPCCNPHHLWEGTHTQNMRDMIAKGRRHQVQQRGESNPGAKLSEFDVQNIIRMICAGASNKGTARHYSLHHSTVSCIRQGTTWGHLPRPYGTTPPAYERPRKIVAAKVLVPRRQLSVEAVRNFHAKGLSLRQIAREVGFSHIAVRNRLLSIATKCE